MAPRNIDFGLDRAYGGRLIDGMDLGVFYFVFLMVCTIGFAGVVAYLAIVSAEDK